MKARRGLLVLLLLAVVAVPLSATPAVAHYTCDSHPHTPYLSGTVSNYIVWGAGIHCSHQHDRYTIKVGLQKKNSSGVWVELVVNIGDTGTGYDTAGWHRFWNRSCAAGQYRIYQYYGRAINNAGVIVHHGGGGFSNILTVFSSDCN